MNFLRITEDTTRDDLVAAIGHLRAKQIAARDAQVVEELRADELLDLLGALG